LEEITAYITRALAVAQGTTGSDVSVWISFSFVNLKKKKISSFIFYFTAL